MSLYDFFAVRLPEERLLKDEPMSRHTTFHVGGPAEVMFLPSGEEELAQALLMAKEAACPVFFMGRGSNLLVRDGGIKGLVILMGESFSGIRIEANDVYAKAGDGLIRLAGAAYEAGLSGLEFASGIPGSVGGGMAMNAGAYGGQLSDVTVSARLMDVNTGEVRELPIEELKMGYRESRALSNGEIVTGAHFRLKPGDKAEIKALMDELNSRRREKQPLSFPSAGSTFKRPTGYFAGALIEQAGLKGASVGGAEVSTLHAGFIINRGGATAADILALMKHVTERVLETSGVTLEPEVRIIGSDA